MIRLCASCYRAFPIFKLGVKEMEIVRTSSTVAIIASPTTALVDEKIKLNISGLVAHQQVTVSSYVNEDNKRFAGFAHFTANNDGSVNVITQPSLGGSYIGLHDMGLFTHVLPLPGQKQGLRLLQRDVSKPLSFVLSVHDGHLSDSKVLSGLPHLTALSSCTVLRTYKAQGVTRTFVRDGCVRGALFLPPGPGPFPGIIDMFGTIGGLVEFRASLLASRGFACLALPYFGYEDLPDAFDTDLSYFEEATNWLISHSQVMSSGIGVIGVSKGAEIAAAMAAFFSHVKLAVCINGPYYYWCTNYRGKSLEGDVQYPLTPMCEDVDGSWKIDKTDIDYSVYDSELSGVIPVENAQGHIVYVVGEDDGTQMSGLCAQQSYRRLQSRNKTNFTVLTYPSAGHLIEPPYSPVCNVAFHPMASGMMQFGGQPDGHAAAQEHCWTEVLRLFRQHLSTTESKL